MVFHIECYHYNFERHAAAHKAVLQLMLFRLFPVWDLLQTECLCLTKIHVQTVANVMAFGGGAFGR